MTAASLVDRALSCGFTGLVMLHAMMEAMYVRGKDGGGESGWIFHSAVSLVEHVQLPIKSCAAGLSPTGAAFF